MTLTTHIRLIEPKASPDEVWEFCASLVKASPWAEWDDRGQGDKYFHWEPWTRSRCMLPNQGFYALLYMRYAVDGPIPALVHEEEGYDPSVTLPPACAYDVSFDQPYSCTNLEARHDWFVLRLAEFCAEHGIDWWAENEFSGEWYHRGLPFGGAHGLLDHNDGWVELIPPLALEPQHDRS